VDQGKRRAGFQQEYYGDLTVFGLRFNVMAKLALPFFHAGMLCGSLRGHAFTFLLHLAFFPHFDTSMDRVSSFSFSCIYHRCSLSLSLRIYLHFRVFFAVYQGAESCVSSLNITTAVLPQPMISIETNEPYDYGSYMKVSRLHIDVDALMN